MRRRTRGFLALAALVAAPLASSAAATPTGPARAGRVRQRHFRAPAARWVGPGESSRAGAGRARQRWSGLCSVYAVHARAPV